MAQYKNEYLVDFKPRGIPFKLHLKRVKNGPQAGGYTVDVYHKAKHVGRADGVAPDPEEAIDAAQVVIAHFLNKHAASKAGPKGIMKALSLYLKRRPDSSKIHGGGLVHDKEGYPIIEILVGNSADRAVIRRLFPNDDFHGYKVDVKVAGKFKAQSSFDGDDKPTKQKNKIDNDFYLKLFVWLGSATALFLIGRYLYRSATGAGFSQAAPSMATGGGMSGPAPVVTPQMQTPTPIQNPVPMV